MSGIPKCWWVPLASVAAALWLSPSASAQATSTEQQVKAGFVLNFARYVEWPERVFAARDAPLVICILGRDNFGAAMTALEGRQVQGRPVKLRRGVAIEDMRGCHVVFVSESEDRRLVPTLHSLAGQPILTVSDMEGFIDAGGAIGIVQGEDRLQFEINRSALDQAQLKASSNLLKLARNVADLKGRN
jgi:hypothetical protein